MTTRSVPYDLTAEQSVLGCLLWDPRNLDVVRDLVQPADFYQEAHGWIYAAMLDLAARRDPVDFVTLCHELEARDRLAAVGGDAYLTGLLNRNFVLVNADVYAALVAKTATLRRLISVGGAIAALGYEEVPALPVVLSQAESLLFAVTQARADVADDATLEGAIDTYLDDLGKRMAGLVRLRGWSTGISDLDDLTYGARGGKVWAVTAESGEGKSTFIRNLGYAFQSKGARVALLSLEMTAADLAEATLAYRSGVDSALLATGELTEAQLRRVYDVGTAPSTVPPIRLAAGGGKSLRDVQALARRWQAAGGLDILLIDYYGLLTPPSNDTAGWDLLANGIKGLANEMDITVIAPAQITKEGQRLSAQEATAHMRNGAALYQAADIAIALDPDERPARVVETPRRLQAHVNKHRGGPTGSVKLLWWMATGRMYGEETHHDR